MRRYALSLLLPLLAIPGGWPHHVAIGLSDPPGDARALVRHAPFDFRYQYLAGGVNTGHGWATWNPAGSFVTLYVHESIAARVTPVFTYYQMLQGYLEQARATSLARSFARRLIALRHELAPHALLAWHLSVWGTGEDPTYSKPSLARMDELAARSAAFYEALGAHFDLAFNDVTDRDAGFYRVIEGNPNTAWGPADFGRHDAYIAGFTRRTHLPVVLWQLPLGNTTLNDTWGHFRDNRVQWWLGSGSAAHLKATRDSGVIGLLFGGGAGGTTSAQTDGGLFFRLSSKYLANPLTLR